MTQQATVAVPRAPWEKQRGETGAAFAAFAAYRDMGPLRAARKVAQQIGKSASLIEKWSATNDWVERCHEFDIHMDRARLATSEREWERTHARHAVIAGSITSALEARLTGNDTVRALNPADIEWEDVRSLAKDGIAMERVIHGHPADFALKVLSMNINDALQHVRMLIDLAQQHMTEREFNAFLTAYASATAAEAGLPPPVRAIEQKEE